MTLREEVLNQLNESNTTDKDFNKRVERFNAELNLLLKKYGLFIGVGYEDPGDDDQLIAYDSKDGRKVSYIDGEY